MYKDRYFCRSYLLYTLKMNLYFKINKFVLVIM